MYKTLTIIALLSITCITAQKSTLSVGSKHIKQISSPIKPQNYAIDWCPQCVNTFGDLIELVLDAILQYGVLNTCGELCDIVAEKSGSSLLGFVCMVGCDVLGIEEFVKTIQKADLDPIYYCEIIKKCPINDDGDAKFKSFVILPRKGPVGTKFTINYAYATLNGTGTGELIVDVATVDKVPLSANFLNEAKKPGTYGNRLSFDATPDPDCNPLQEECEQWLPGVYNVTITICNGQCGSHHPHTQLYDTAINSFEITP